MIEDRMRLPGLDMQAIDDDLGGTDPRSVVEWVWNRFGPSVAVSSSFQTQSIPLLHIISEVAPEVTVIFLDTGYHFPETLEFRDGVVDRLGLGLRVIRASEDRTELLHREGPEPYLRDPDMCCYVNKVEPMERVMADYTAWISGIRRDQSPARAEARTVEPGPRGTVRVHPLLEWTRKDVKEYRTRHRLPSHPLEAEGYASIGCAPCTRGVDPDDDLRAGRWAGRGKVECGLHTLLRTMEDPGDARGSIPAPPEPTDDGQR